MRYYTIGMIARNGLLLGPRGMPLRDKAGVSRRIRKLAVPTEKRSTPHGDSIVVSATELLKANQLPI